MRKVLFSFFTLALFAFIVTASVYAQAQRSSLTMAELKVNQDNIESSTTRSELRLVRYPSAVAPPIAAGSSNIEVARFAVQSTVELITVNKIMVHSRTPMADQYIQNIRFFQDGFQYGEAVQFTTTDGTNYFASIPVMLPVSGDPTHDWVIIADVNLAAIGTISVGLTKIRIDNRYRISIYSLPVYGANHPIFQEPAHVAGTNVRDGGELWLITDVGTRRKYSSDFAFTSYRFNSLNAVAPISIGDLQLPIGPPILPAEGKVYIQSTYPNYKQVYLISGNTGHMFASDTVFLGMGFTFHSAEQADLSLANVGYTLTSPSERHPKGVLINDGGSVHYTTNTGRIGIPSIDVFNSWGLSFADVVTATTGDQNLPMEGVMQARAPGQLTPQ